MSRPPEPTPDPAPSLVIGLSGGIASGKSAVARLLAGEHGVVIDADRLAHEALASEEVRALVRERFGAQVFDAEGAVDRAALAREVFSHPDQRAVLEGWIHPRVRVSMTRRLEESRARNVPRIVLDVPLLFENDDQHQLTRECDVLVFVDASKETRAARVAENRGWERDELSRREACQASLDEKRKRSDHVIQNDGDLEQLEAAVRRLDQVLESRGRTP